MQRLFLQLPLTGNGGILQYHCMLTVIPVPLVVLSYTTILIMFIAAPASGLPSQLDITSLFSKLVSSGILKEPLKPASPLPDQTSAPAAAPAQKAKEGGEAEGEKEEDDSQEVEDDGSFDIPPMALVNEELKV